jgi:phosphoribosylaminoimidazolecarboxamide formyltransferase / IMP cyclohydrolase
MDPNYVPPAVETRQVYGVSMQQIRNNAKIDESLFSNLVTKNKDVSPSDDQLYLHFYFIFIL